MEGGHRQDRSGEPFDLGRGRMWCGSAPFDCGPGFYLFQLNGWRATARRLAPNFKSRTTPCAALVTQHIADSNRHNDPTQCVQYLHRKMAALVRAIALAAGFIALSDVSSAAPCRHFSIWNFPWPQRCPANHAG